jgi:hypothetical protein
MQALYQTWEQFIPGLSKSLSKEQIELIHKLFYGFVSVIITDLMNLPEEERQDALDKWYNECVEFRDRN